METLLSSDLMSLVPWVMSHGYLIFLIVALFGGPFATMAAGIAAGLGYFNIYIIMIIALLGDIGGDIIFYGIGYANKNFSNSKTARFLGLTRERVERVEKLLHNHTLKAVILIKISPMIGPLGLIIIGTAKTNFRKFMISALKVALPKTIVYIAIGYLSAETYIELSQFFAKGQFIILGSIIFLSLCYYLYTRIIKIVEKKFEK